MELIDWSDLLKGPLNVLPYGEPGCGKTRLALSVGEVLYTLYLDVDNGLKTILTIPKAQRDLWMSNIVPLRFTDFKDLDKIYQLLTKNDPVLWTKHFASIGHPEVIITKPFEAIVVDTWSMMNWEIKEEKRKNIGKQGAGALAFRPNIEIQDWGNIIDLNEMAIKAFCELPVTFVCCMHEQFFEDKKGGRTSGTPAINGKFAPEIGKYFDIVGHMSVNVTGDYVMDTAMKARYQAKTRIPLEKQLKHITYKGILDAIIK